MIFSRTRSGVVEFHSGHTRHAWERGLGGGRPQGRLAKWHSPRVPLGVPGCDDPPHAGPPSTASALAVVEPTGSGLTGGGIYLLHRQRDGFEVAIDAREFAPAAASRDMYLDPQGNPVPGLSTDSALAAGIPGEPAGMAMLAARYGRLPVARSLAPAIRLARDGFPLSKHLQDGLTARLEQFRKEPDVARNFLRDGAVPPLGTVRFDHTMTLLLSGQVLVAGGVNSSSQVLATAELYAN